MKSSVCTLLVSLFYLALSGSFAQGIVFERGSWADAVKKARKEKKLLFLQVDNPTCGSCDQVASTAFASPLLREKFAQHFISYRIDGTSGAGKAMVDQYDIACTPSSIFLDTDEFPLARYCGTTSFDRAYLEKAEEALERKRLQPLKSLVDAYNKGDRSLPLMRQYITRRHEVGLPTQLMLDEYVAMLPADSLRSGSVLRFLFEQGPIVGSKADSVFRREYRLVDSLYKAVGWNKAVELNNLVTDNSIRKAIKEKDQNLAFRTASFRQRTYGTDYRGGTMARDWVLLRYYRGTNDTVRYLRGATQYYDRYFMPARVDSIQKLDELEMQRMMRGQTPPAAGKAKTGGIVSRAFVPYPNTQRYVSALNQGAWDFYNTTRDTTYLQKALAWSKRSLEYREDSALMDTYAHLLYRLGRKQEALEWQQKAVSTAQGQNLPVTDSLLAALRKMKDGTL